MIKRKRPFKKKILPEECLLEGDEWRWDECIAL